MGRQALKTGAVLIGMYLVAAKASEWGKLFGSAGKAGTGLVKVFQGR